MEKVRLACIGSCRGLDVGIYEFVLVKDQNNARNVDLESIVLGDCWIF